MSHDEDIPKELPSDFQKLFENGKMRPDAMTHCSHGKSYRNEDCPECDSVWGNAMITNKERELSATVKEQAAKIAGLITESDGWQNRFDLKEQELHQLQMNYEASKSHRFVMGESIAKLEATIADWTRRCEAGNNKLDWLETVERVAELEALIKASQEPIGIIASSVFGDVQWTEKGHNLKIGAKLYATPCLSRSSHDAIRITCSIVDSWSDNYSSY